MKSVAYPRANLKANNSRQQKGVAVDFLGADGAARGMLGCSEKGWQNDRVCMPGRFSMDVIKFESLDECAVQ